MSGVSIRTWLAFGLNAAKALNLERAECQSTLIVMKRVRRRRKAFTAQNPCRQLIPPQDLDYWALPVYINN